MAYKLSNARRYLNGELVDPPQLGPWVEGDLFPEVEYDDLITAGLFEISADEDEWDEVEAWLELIWQSDEPLLFLIERCCDDGEILPVEMIEARLKDCPQTWINACRHAIDEAPAELVNELLSVVSWAVRIERARRFAEPEASNEKRSTLVVHHGKPPMQLDMFKPIYWND